MMLIKALQLVTGGEVCDGLRSAHCVHQSIIKMNEVVVQPFIPSHQTNKHQGSQKRASVEAPSHLSS